MGLGIKKGDMVAVTAGKEKGKRGRVLSVLPGDGGNSKVIVEKINIIKKHMKPSKTHERGGIIEKEGALHVSNVALVCPKCGEKSKIVALVQAGGAKKLRACKKCKEVID